MGKIITNAIFSRINEIKHKSNNVAKLRAALMSLPIVKANKSLKMNRSVLSIVEYNSIYREINNISLT